MTCPPCNGNCRQGRDCPARQGIDWDRIIVVVVMIMLGVITALLV